MNTISKVLNKVLPVTSVKMFSDGPEPSKTISRRENGLFHSPKEFEALLPLPSSINEGEGGFSDPSRNPHPIVANFTRIGVRDFKTYSPMSLGFNVNGCYPKSRATSCSFLSEASEACLHYYPPKAAEVLRISPRIPNRYTTVWALAITYVPYILVNIYIRSCQILYFLLN